MLPSFAQAGYTLAGKLALKNQAQIRAHIIISGKGNDLRLNPMIAALAKAKKIESVFSDEQIIILNVQEVSAAEHISTINSFGFNIIRNESRLLDEATLMQELEAYYQIASIDFFGHSGIEPGIFLDGIGENDLKWRPFDKMASRLIGHFTEDAYAVLNGCNQGQLQAPTLSKLWQIPVAGTLTSSHFEILFNDGKYYWNEASNHNLFASNSQASLRMKPDYVVYDGVYGHYQSGLPFFKFFCAGISSKSCHTGMRASVYVIVGPDHLSHQSSEENYLKVVREWLCPSSEYGSKLQTECMTRLNKISSSSTDKTYSPFKGTSLQCNFDACYPKKCFKSAIDMSVCAKAKPTNLDLKTTTFVDEYLNYMEAFETSQLK